MFEELAMSVMIGDYSCSQAFGIVNDFIAT